MCVVHLQIQFVQCDRGVYMYRTDTLTLTLSMEGPQLLLVLKPHRESVWAASEVDSMVTFFRTHLLCPPFAVQAMTSLANALSLPIATLKSLVLLMQAQMVSYCNFSSSPQGGTSHTLLCTLNMALNQLVSSPRSCRTPSRLWCGTSACVSPSPETTTSQLSQEAPSYRGTAPSSTAEQSCCYL